MSTQRERELEHLLEKAAQDGLAHAERADAAESDLERERTARRIVDEALKLAHERVRFLEVRVWHGYTLVPNKPTPQMLAALFGHSRVTPTPEESYAAMLKVAPQP